MPVTIKTADHTARECTQGKGPARSPESLLKDAYPSEFQKYESLVQSSFGEESLASVEAPLFASENGFVKAAVSAYNQHHHLTIRPEDVWFGILTQLGFFINGNAEELRSFFVSHEDKKKLIVEMHSYDFGGMAITMTDLISKNIIDPDLKTWIMPDFSTTQETDKVVAAILMMGAMQNYFSYHAHVCCGIPSVTLLGERADWVKLRDRLEMLPRLGSQPAQFGALLVPILGYFIQSFDDPSDPAVINFWGRIAHKISQGSGPTYLSGWITAFCFWDIKGKLLGRDQYKPGCNLDGTIYHCIDISDIPPGSAGVPVKVNDNGNIYNARMVAGSVAIRATSSGELVEIPRYPAGHYRRPDGTYAAFYNSPKPEPRPGLDSLQPVSGWWMYRMSGKGNCEMEDEVEDAEETTESIDSHIARMLKANYLAQQKRAAERLAAGQGGFGKLAVGKDGETGTLSDQN